MQKTTPSTPTAQTGTAAAAAAAGSGSVLLLSNTEAELLVNSPKIDAQLRGQVVEELKTVLKVDTQAEICEKLRLDQSMLSTWKLHPDGSRKFDTEAANRLYAALSPDTRERIWRAVHPESELAKKLMQALRAAAPTLLNSPSFDKVCRALAQCRDLAKTNLRRRINCTD